MPCLLSVIIISHNQKELFRRCIDSVLAQDLPFEHEIIVSDDASTDGTWELILEYQDRYPGLVRAYQCNSDDCNPSVISERAAYNRINGLKHSCGKYLVHIDGDDFFVGERGLLEHVSILESHPECTISCQNYLWKEDDKTLDECKMVFSTDMFKAKTVMSADEFISKIPYIHISACCVRNTREVDASILLCTQYDDVDIIFQFIRNGKVVLANNCGFVYCHHKSDSASNFQPIGQIICWLTPVSSCLIAPQCTGSLFRHGLKQILDVLNYIKKDFELDDDITEYLKKSTAFIFNGIDGRTCSLNKIRYLFARLWIRIMIKFKLNIKCAYRVLYRLIITFKVPKEVEF